MAHSSSCRSLSFDRIAERYDETRGGEDRGRRFAGELAGHLDGRLPALEIGIGTGLIALGLRDLGHRVTGVDLSFEMLSRARDRLGALMALVAGDARRLPLADSSFDQAYSVWVLHVVGDKRGVLAEVARVLRPRGRYLVVPGFSPNPGDPIGKAILEMQLRVDPGGVRRDDSERLRELASGTGLRVDEVLALGPHDYEESPAQALGKIESRSYSILWGLPDDRWDEAVRPTIEVLRALPDPDVPIKRRSSGNLVVLRRGSRPGRGDRVRGDRLRVDCAPMNRDSEAKSTRSLVP